MSFPEVMIDRHQMPDVCDYTGFTEQVINDVNSRISVIKQAFERPRVVDKENKEIIISDSPIRYDVYAGDLLKLVGLSLSIAEELDSPYFINMENPKKCKLLYAFISNIIETGGVIYKNYMRVAQISALIEIHIIHEGKIKGNNEIISDSFMHIKKNLAKNRRAMQELYELYIEAVYKIRFTININEINQKYKQIIDKLKKIKESDDKQIKRIEKQFKRLSENGKLPPNFKPPDLGPMAFDIYYPKYRDPFLEREDFLKATDNMGEPTDADTAARNQYMGDTLPKMAIAEFLGGKSKSRRSRK